MQEYTIVNGELYHAGVKGMKWGHRKAPEISTPPTASSNGQQSSAQKIANGKATATKVLAIIGGVTVAAAATAGAVYAGKAIAKSIKNRVAARNEKAHLEKLKAMVDRLNRTSPSYANSGKGLGHLREKATGGARRFLEEKYRPRPKSQW